MTTTQLQNTKATVLLALGLCLTFDSGCNGCRPESTQALHRRLAGARIEQVRPVDQHRALVLRHSGGKDYLLLEDCRTGIQWSTRAFASGHFFHLFLGLDAVAFPAAGGDSAHDELVVASLQSGATTRIWSSPFARLACVFPSMPTAGNQIFVNVSRERRAGRALQLLAFNLAARKLQWTYSPAGAVQYRALLVTREHVAVQLERIAPRKLPKPTARDRVENWLVILNRQNGKELKRLALHRRSPYGAMYRRGDSLFYLGPEGLCRLELASLRSTVVDPGFWRSATRPTGYDQVFSCGWHRRMLICVGVAGRPGEDLDPQDRLLLIQARVPGQALSWQLSLGHPLWGITPTRLDNTVGRDFIECPPGARCGDTALPRFVPFLLSGPKKESRSLMVVDLVQHQAKPGKRPLSRSGIWRIVRDLHGSFFFVDDDTATLARFDGHTGKISAAIQCGNGREGRLARGGDHWACISQQYGSQWVPLHRKTLQAVCDADKHRVADVLPAVRRQLGLR